MCTKDVRSAQATLAQMRQRGLQAKLSAISSLSSTSSSTSDWELVSSCDSGDWILVEDKVEWSACGCMFSWSLQAAWFALLITWAAFYEAIHIQEQADRLELVSDSMVALGDWRYYRRSAGTGMECTLCARAIAEAGGHVHFRTDR